MACCVAVRNNRMWCWESSLKSISDTVISSLTHHHVRFQLPPPPSQSLFQVEFSVCKKKPSLFFTWIGSSSNQLKILGWHVTSSSRAFQACCHLLSLHTSPALCLERTATQDFGYSREILHNFPYAAPCHGLLGQVSCCCFKSLQDSNHEMID